ncbi:MAG: cupin-like domain-containing protein [Bacteroidetes bacterium]|nr:cupin-like domain-containing protein [Bacteroidota bacterium]
MAHASPLLQENMPGIERRSSISTMDFIREYVEPGRPLILTDFAKQYPALGKWTPHFFSSHYGSLSHEVKGVRYSIAEQMGLIQTSTEEKPAPYSYNLNIDLAFPELRPDVEPLLLGRRDRLATRLLLRKLTRGTIKHEVFFGGKGASFPYLHVDLQHLHTQITQLYGDKEFFLFPPDQTPYMYPKPDYPLVSAVDNVFNPDPVRFPLFCQAKGHREMLKEGETIFFPTGWWHMTRIPGPSISYGRALLERGNWPAYLKDTYNGWKQKSALMAMAAYAIGRCCGALMDLGEPALPLI